MHLASQTLSCFSTEIQQTTEHLRQLVDEQYYFIIDVIKIRKKELTLKTLMKKANTYSEWRQHALEYDSLKSNSVLVAAAIALFILR